MKPPRVRFTMRRMMAVVAAAGLALGAFDRRQRFQRLSDLHAARCRTHTKDGGGWYDWEGREIKDDGLYRAEIKHHVEMRNLYGFRARYPWLPTLADPTAPVRSPRGGRDPRINGG